MAAEINEMLEEKFRSCFPVTEAVIEGFEGETPKPVVFKVGEGFDLSLIEDYKLSCNCGTATALGNEFKFKSYALPVIANDQNTHQRTIALTVFFNDGREMVVKNTRGVEVENPQKQMIDLKITIITKKKPKQ